MYSYDKEKLSMIINGGNSIWHGVPELTDKGSLYNPIVVTNDKLINAFSKINMGYDFGLRIEESAYFIKWLEMSVRHFQDLEKTKDTEMPLKDGNYRHLQAIKMNCIENFGNEQLPTITQRLAKLPDRNTFNQMLELSLDVIRKMYEDPTSNAYEKNTLLQMKDVYEKFYAPAIPLYMEAGKKVEKIQNEFYNTFLNDVEHNRKNGTNQRNYSKNNDDNPSIGGKN